MNKRWYDTIEYSNEVFEKLRCLNRKDAVAIAKNLSQIACSIKAIKREQEEVPLSIGVNRVMGLYQQEKGRRWYDRNPELSVALKAISTLSADEYEGIMEALNETIK